MKTLNDFNFNVGDEITIFIDNRDQVAIIDEIFDEFMLVTIHKTHQTDSFAIGICEYCKGLGYIVIYGRENTPEDCPECNGYMLSRKGESK